MNALSIHIPEPCHEDWQQMTPVDKGRFCQSCAKQVVDFSMMTDQEILRYISKASGGLCGRFADDQLQRPLLPVKQEKKRVWWMAAAMPLLMLFEKSKAQKAPPATVNKTIISMAGKVSGMVEFQSSSPSKKIKMNRQKGDSTFTLDGHVVSEKTGLPISFASVVDKNNHGTATDKNGDFSIHGVTKKDHITLTVESVGYADKEIYISLKDTEAVQQQPVYNVKGHVEDADSGVGVPFASIFVKGTKTAAAADMQGNFTLNVDTKNAGVVLVIISVGYYDQEIPLTAGGLGQIINVDTIKLKPKPASPNDFAIAGLVSVCQKPSQKDTIPTLIRKVFNVEKFKVSPNPAPKGGTLNIDAKEEGSYSIQLFDNRGKLVQVKQFEAIKGATQTSLDLPSSLAAGMYYIRLVDEKNKKQYTDKIVVE